ncbi:MAG: ribonuclease Y [Anaerolineae bacterium]|nr:ribonuclease Y [Anaerolineae bacterium]
MGPGSVIWIILAGVIGAFAGGAIVAIIERTNSSSQLKLARARAVQMTEEAETAAKAIRVQAEEEAIQTRNQAEVEGKRRMQELRQEEERLQKRRETLDQRVDRLEDRERKLNQRQSRVDKMKNDIEEMYAARQTELERIANLTEEEAKELLLQDVETRTRDEMAHVIRNVEAQVRHEAEKKAREIITMAIQRCASDQVSETTVSMVMLPSDEMKGRIIGRSGRNIRAFEQATGVDVIVDDTPEAVVLSSFDPVRREVARLSLTKLVNDGRIHPGRIEGLVAKSQKEVEIAIREAGEQAVVEVGLPGLHPKLIEILGRLKYRTSYGQNVLLHSIEMAHLAGMMAYELGADVNLAKEGALLHDIGKAVDHEVEGTHAGIGAELAEQYGCSPLVVNCIIAHHGEQEQRCLEAVLVEAADAISSARPGARRESLENYLKRVKGLEEIANSFSGVSQSYAIQAGREIRIMVKPEDIDDLASIQLSKDIARRVEDTLQYPGQIKVTVIRETRSTEYAK